MTIERMLELAKKEREKLTRLRERDALIDKEDLLDAEKIIEGLRAIIYWYDENQRRLIKGLSRLAKRNKILRMDVDLLTDAIRYNEFDDINNPA